MGYISDQLIANCDASPLYAERSKSYFEVKLSPKNTVEIDKYSKNGFTIFSQNSRTVVLRKDKDPGTLFEHRVWCVLYKMGFSLLNGKEKFVLKHGEGEGLNKQIDVFAVDDEVILIIECKTKEKAGAGTFKDNIDAYKGNMPGFKKYIYEEFPQDKKIVFIYATYDVVWSENDENRLNQITEVKKVHLNEDNIKYYEDLSANLQSAAKYQFLGQLFRGDKIKGMDSTVPAIKGTMGDVTYYLFSIEPARLLKFCYILHRNSTHSSADLTPAYQRLIKKDRLNKIRKFIDAGNHFFPNNIIISIETKNQTEKELAFDSAPKQFNTNRARLGTLHLPQTYQSAFVIDGQHRLYGYSNTKYAETDVIPVIAFVNMTKPNQVEMFMNINTNQKAVDVNLRNTLAEFLFWESPEQNDVREAILLRTAMVLGDSDSSPLYKRIVTGEDAKDSMRCITLQTMKNAFKDTDFVNKYNKNKLIKEGMFDCGDTDALKKQTVNNLIAVVSKYFETVTNNLKEEWNKGSQGFLCTNNVVYGLITTLNEYLNHFIEKGKINTKTETIDKIRNFVKTNVAETVALALSDIVEDEINDFFRSRGQPGCVKAGKYICYKIHLIDNEFNPKWLPSFIDEYLTHNNAEAREIADDLLFKSRTLFRKLLVQKHGTNWQLTGMDTSTNIKLVSLKQTNDASLAHNNQLIPDTDILDFASFEELARIANYPGNWKDLFSKIYKNKNKLFGGTENNVLIPLSTIYKQLCNGKNIRQQLFEELNAFSMEFLEVLKQYD